MLNYERDAILRVLRAGSILVSILVFASASFAQRPIPGNPQDAIQWLIDSGNSVVRKEGEVTSVTIDYIPQIFVVGDLDVFPKLSELHINYTGSFYDYHMSGIARLKNVKTVYFYRCSSISDATLGALRHLPKLEYLKLRSCPKIYSLAALNSCRNLKRLQIRNVNKNIFDEFQRLKILNQIEDLEIGDCQYLNVGHARIIATAKNLKRLRLDSCSALTDKFFQPLANLPNLESVELHYCRKLAGDFLSYLPPTTKSLDLKKLQILPEHISQLERFNNLESLKCQSIFKAPQRNASQADWDSLHRATNLKKVYLPNISIRDQQLASWDSLTQLESLDLSRSTGFSGAGLRCLRSMKNLETLNLSGCRLVDSRELPHFQNLERLKTLDLSATKVGKRTDGTVRETSLTRKHWI